jgi:hypothetical protein
LCIRLPNEASSDAVSGFQRPFLTGRPIGKLSCRLDKLDAHVYKPGFNLKQRAETPARPQGQAKRQGQFK